MPPRRGRICGRLTLDLLSAHIFEADASGGLMLVSCQMEDVRALAPYIAAHHRSLHVHHHLAHTPGYQSRVVRLEVIMLPFTMLYNAAKCCKMMYHAVSCFIMLYNALQRIVMLFNSRAL